MSGPMYGMETYENSSILTFKLFKRQKDVSMCVWWGRMVGGRRKETFFQFLVDVGIFSEDCGKLRFFFLEQEMGFSLILFPRLSLCLFVCFPPYIYNMSTYVNMCFTLIRSWEKIENLSL